MTKNGRTKKQEPRRKKPAILGLLKGLVPYEEFNRHKEGFEPEENDEAETRP